MIHPDVGKIGLQIRGKVMSKSPRSLRPPRVDIVIARNQAHRARGQTEHVVEQATRCLELDFEREVGDIAADDQMIDGSPSEMLENGAEDVVLVVMAAAKAKIRVTGHALVEESEGHRSGKSQDVQ